MPHCVYAEGLKVVKPGRGRGHLLRSRCSLRLERVAALSMDLGLGSHGCILLGVEEHKERSLASLVQHSPLFYQDLVLQDPDLLGIKVDEVLLWTCRSTHWSYQSARYETL